MFFRYLYMDFLQKLRLQKSTIFLGIIVCVALNVFMYFTSVKSHLQEYIVLIAMISVAFVSGINEFNEIKKACTTDLFLFKGVMPLSQHMKTFIHVANGGVLHLLSLFFILYSLHYYKEVNVIGFNLSNLAKLALFTFNLSCLMHLLSFRFSIKSILNTVNKNKTNIILYSLEIFVTVVVLFILLFFCHFNDSYFYKMFIALITFVLLFQTNTSYKHLLLVF